MDYKNRHAKLTRKVRDANNVHGEIVTELVRRTARKLRIRAQR